MPPPENSTPPQSIEDLVRQVGDTVTAGLQKLTREVQRVADDVSDLRGRVTDVERRQNTNSDRAKSLASTTSSADLEHAAQLAEEITAREQLSKDVAGLVASQGAQMKILTNLEKLTGNPLVRRVATTAATIFLTWAALHAAPPAPPPAPPTTYTAPIIIP